MISGEALAVSEPEPAGDAELLRHSVAVKVPERWAEPEAVGETVPARTVAEPQVEALAVPTVLPLELCTMELLTVPLPHTEKVGLPLPEALGLAPLGEALPELRAEAEPSPCVSVMVAVEELQPQALGDRVPLLLCTMLRVELTVAKREAELRTDTLELPELLTLLEPVGQAELDLVTGKEAEKAEEALLLAESLREPLDLPEPVGEAV